MLSKFLFPLIMLGFLIATSLAETRIVLASQETACIVQQRTHSTLTALCQPGWFSATDRIQIVGSGVMQYGENPGDVLQRAKSIPNTTVLFDTGNDQHIELAISFSLVENYLAAAIFDDQNGDRKVAYQIEGEQVQILEPGPTMTIYGHDGWLEDQDLFNWNLDIEIDGQVSSTMLDEIYMDRIALDSTIHTRIYVRDNNRNGLPEIEWRKSRPNVPSSWNVIRTTVIVNTEDDEFPLEPGRPWYLISPERWQLTKNYGTSKPPLIVDWAEARIELLNEFVASRTNPGNFFVYTFHPLEEGVVSKSNWEDPFAFYNFSGINDEESRTYPNVLIRIAHFHQGEFSDDINDHLPTSVQQIDYTWRFTPVTASAPIWDYRLSIAGRVSITETYPLGPFTTNTIPFSKLPAWVMQQPWDYTTFVAREGPGIQNTEGIGAIWTILESARPTGTQFLTGRIDEFTSGHFDEIPVGWRGEFGMLGGVIPELCVSLIDQRVHLLQAEFGLWAVDDGYTISYYRDPNSSCINRWQVIGDQSKKEQLFHIENHLVYSTSDQIFVKQLVPGTNTITFLPPHNIASWQEARASAPTPSQSENCVTRGSTSDDQSLLPCTLKSMFDLADGRLISAMYAKMSNYRADQAGRASFTLEITPGSHHRGLEVMGISKIDPSGSYRITFQDGIFKAQKITPPNPSVTLSTTELTQYEAGAMTLHLHNDGLTDLPAATIEIWGTPESGSAMLVMTRTLALLSQQSQDLLLSWTPPMAGDWTLMPILRSSGNEVWELPSTRVSVQPTEASDPLTLLKASSTAAMLGFTLVGLLGLTILAVFAFASQWSRRGLEQCDDPD
ncbi:hypothetical protein [Candidatus Chloroploca asiatica]|uniref:Uncharacterized protein n=1 Tax=Candidatus Chloroploca asiatica TaxID=1506545 RepID=A0A2H3L2T5_9CHLR|nr:hypothetical protein [Candidatus Chloroploca asiatica]PDV99077.1 hypothetical protein A9Q02_13410 [Candidatus Chloroploca asiatica]